MSQLLLHILHNAKSTLQSDAATKADALDDLSRETNRPLGTKSASSSQNRAYFDHFFDSNVLLTKIRVRFAKN